jgi:hypothetical protein
MIHGRDSFLAVFLEVYSMYGIPRRAIKPDEGVATVDHIAAGGILPDERACA